MIRHLVYYRIKVLLNDRLLIFWTFVFPLIMGLLFKLVFSNLDEIQFLDTEIPIAVVGRNQEFSRGLTEVKNQKKPMFNVKRLDQKTAEQKLTRGDIEGYFDTNSHPIKLVIAENGSTQKILQGIMNQYEQSQTMYTELAKSGQLNSANLKVAREHHSVNSAKNRKFSIMSFYFFTLVAMTIGYGTQYGLRNSEDEQADQSENGIRLHLTPVPKMMVVISNLIGALIVFYSIVLIILAIFHFVYQVDFGNRWALILLVCLIGSVLQICLGKLIGNSLNQRNYSEKVAMTTIMISFLSALSGMMGSQSIKHWIDLHMPLLGKLNVVNLVSDSIYQLFFYDSLTTFYQNLIWLVVLTILFIIFDYRFERKVQYVSL